MLASKTKRYLRGKRFFHILRTLNTFDLFHIKLHKINREYNFLPSLKSILNLIRQHRILSDFISSYDKL